MKTLYLFTILFFIVGFVSSQNSHRDKIDVQHYNINIDVSSLGNYSLSGHTEIIFRAIDEPLEQVAFDLYKYHIDSVSLNGVWIDDFDYNDTVISFYPAAEINAEQNDTCTIYYHGYGSLEPGGGWGGVHFSSNMVFNMGVALDAIPHGFGRAWFPCIDNFTDRATYEFHIITRDDHRAIASGQFQEVNDYGEDELKWHWSLGQTSPTYLVSFAVGPFTLNDTVYDGMNGSVPVEYYAINSDSSAAVATFADVPEMLALFEDKFGPYHWEKAGYTVVDFNSGAMEHLTNIAYPSYALTTDPGNQTLVAHELSHHWFGNLVTCSDAADMWLNEGWASYCEAIYMEHFHGTEQYRQYVKSNQISVVNSAHETDDGYWALSDMPYDLTYSTTVYDKGSMIVHNLRHYMGDSLFFPAVKDYLSAFSESDASTEDLRDHLSAYSGVDLTGFFDNYVFHGGFPQYSIDSVVYYGDEVKVAVFQQAVGRNFIGDDNKISIGFVDEEWNVHEQWLQFDGQQGSQFFNPGFAPVMVVLDYYNKTAGPVFDHSTVLYNSETYYPTGMDLNVMPEIISDSAFIHVAEMWKGPAESGDNINHIEVLDTKWWRIVFDAKGDFAASGRFYYSFFGNDDVNLEDGDSLMLVYRPADASRWQYIDQSREGTINSGSFIVQNMLQGNYAIARWNEASAIGQLNRQKQIKAWPNPSKKGFYIQLPGSSGQTVYVFNQQGQKIDAIKNNSEHLLYYPAKGLTPGTYFLHLMKSGVSEAQCKIVITP
ncbi:MAG TPA: M1 family aminopeptidase [Salinivirga sp.]|uniref:M1 family aminopeptidase n=1 Tax=Salinivirga sp. TaxID=1970192 RepID=UPI002B46D4AF|nr:M1 family aminopeptidase [Salinivirga sp.]HKK57922.1 M1 family aminopeptidase [Salinivirga sp.]